MLTSLDPEFDKRVRATPEGMAHWAGTGPEGTCCGDCVFLVKRGWLGYGCEKYMRMMGHTPQTALPRQTPSCRHFNPRRPPMHQIPTDEDLEQAADMKQPVNASAPSKAQRTC
jgi:hypothetical protein